MNWASIAGAISKGMLAGRQLKNESLQNSINILLKLIQQKREGVEFEEDRKFKKMQIDAELAKINAPKSATQRLGEIEAMAMLGEIPKDKIPSNVLRKIEKSLRVGGSGGGDGVRGALTQYQNLMLKQKEQDREEKRQEKFIDDMKSSQKEFNENFNIPAHRKDVITRALAKNDPNILLELKDGPDLQKNYFGEGKPAKPVLQENEIIKEIKDSEGKTIGTSINKVPDPGYFEEAWNIATPKQKQRMREEYGPLVNEIERKKKLPPANSTL